MKLHLKLLTPGRVIALWTLGCFLVGFLTGWLL